MTKSPEEIVKKHQKKYQNEKNRKHIQTSIFTFFPKNPKDRNIIRKNNVLEK